MSIFNTPEEKEKRKELLSKLKESLGKLSKFPHEGGNFAEKVTEECSKNQKLLDEYSDYINQNKTEN